MNKKQRLVLAIFVPIIILFITLIIANAVGFTIKTSPRITNSQDGQPRSRYETNTIATRVGNPFDWEKTWYIWFFSLTLCFIFEYKLFSDKKK
jgi:hypothetical protein